MNSRIIIIILSAVIVILAAVNVIMFRADKRPPFIPGPGAEFMDDGPGMGGRHHMPGNRFGRNFCGPDFMRERLNLSSGQIEKIETLNTRFEAETSALFAGLNSERDKLRDLLKADGNPDMKEVKAILERIAALNVELQVLRISQGNEIDRIITPEQKRLLHMERKTFFERMHRRNGGRDD